MNDDLKYKMVQAALMGNVNLLNECFETYNSEASFSSGCLCNEWPFNAIEKIKSASYDVCALIPCKIESCSGIRFVKYGRKNSMAWVTFNLPENLSLSVESAYSNVPSVMFRVGYRAEITGELFMSMVKSGSYSTLPGDTLVTAQATVEALELYNTGP